ncbi:hypothetical protein BDBG_17201 [Blastomyces gilchristii SLH14081]|uniref:Uncharacterized protein n=1 Tax=Blastomyces gilchristii (strain SLH14081) TaxID=559298 RepID=A0A179UN00_BLAGS|nr:uncharacterized protein BDBG_17201 [Blastomyces gilchristii SLH14081]OAT09354.1 hypothetical protein BDBG_17201 [Blastomyces gilchristii SLH14081]
MTSANLRYLKASSLISIIEHYNSYQDYHGLWSTLRNRSHSKGTGVQPASVTPLTASSASITLCVEASSPGQDKRRKLHYPALVIVTLKCVASNTLTEAAMSTMTLNS